MKDGSTLKQTKKALREFENQVDRGLFVGASEILTFKQVAEKWIEHHKANLRQSTWEVYEGHTRNHFGEFFGKFQLGVTPNGFQADAG